MIDARNWEDYSRGHLPHSIFAPFNREFNTLVGCYVEEKTPIYLVIDKTNANQAAIDLVRIGLDDTLGFISPQVLAQYASSGGNLLTSKEIEVAELDKRKGDPNAYLLDVRRLSEVAETGMFPGAHNIAHTRLAPRIDEIPTGKDIYVNCRSGKRSGYACGFLSSRGYNVINVTGGYLAWKKYGGELAPVQTTMASTS